MGGAQTNRKKKKREKKKNQAWGRCWRVLRPGMGARGRPRVPETPLVAPRRTRGANKQKKKEERKKKRTRLGAGAGGFSGRAWVLEGGLGSQRLPWWLPGAPGAQTNRKKRREKKKS